MIIFLIQILILLLLFFLIWKEQTHLHEHQKLRDQVDKVDKSSVALHESYLEILNEYEERKQKRMDE